METFFKPVLTPPRPAASVLLLRDGERGPEVLMLRRHGSSDVLGGVYVFPGGKLDETDGDDTLLGRAGASPDALQARLGEPGLDARVAASFFVAACRETFEEAAVLLARGADAELAERAGRRAREGVVFGALLAEFGLELATEDLVPFSRWITPKTPAMMNKRFDARFFAAALPGGQQARHDDHEATDSVWLTPRAAIERYRRREIVLAPTQIMSLAQVGRHDSVAGVLEEARRRPPPLIEPETFEADGVRTMVYPGDERHSVRLRAMPGPTRLLMRESRFEPPGGYDALFD